MLSVHIAVSVGWLGAVAAFLAVALAAVSVSDADLTRAYLLALGPLTWYAIVPLAIATLLTGIVQSLGTQWGLFQHYWVISKLVITVIVTVLLFDYLRTVAALVAHAEAAPHAGDLGALTWSPVLHAGLALLALLVPLALSVFKPPGLTRYGQRRRDVRARAATRGAVTAAG